MNKFLFTDGTNGVKETQSQEELENFLAATEQPDKVRIWVFNNNEWISYASYRKLWPAISRKESPVPVDRSATQQYYSKKRPQRGGWLKRCVYLVGAAAGVFLVFNFTKLKWERADPLTSAAIRPANVPVMDIDSLITDIETNRGQVIDRNTRNNLRLRNSWPERILLSVNADKETNGNGSRFFNVDISIDNTTGFKVEKAIVKLFVWKGDAISYSDTVQFNNIPYDRLAKRELEFRYKGDSLSVSFESIRAKAFNFCYAASVKNNSGNYNDRWFCRE